MKEREMTIKLVYKTYIGSTINIKAAMMGRKFESACIYADCIIKTSNGCLHTGVFEFGAAEKMKLSCVPIVLTSDKSSIILMIFVWPHNWL